jgi:alkanesulfonate monooxygenase SsuD/methylene tetrahydromethanopterin reductase-like flavin-dependent oxidoreductase (luciferase family)
MQIGVALGTVDDRSGRPVSLAQIAQQAAEAESLGYSTAWVMDHLFIERDGARSGAHDPFVTLAYLAAVTSRITLGVLVAAAPFRDPGQIAREAATVADAAPGRFILGLGAGWHEPEFTAFDLPSESKVSRLEEYLPIVRRLLAGERVDHAGRFYTLREASIPITAARPPIWIAAVRPRMLRLTASEADGWNMAWGDASATDVQRFRTLSAELRTAAAKAGRQRPLIVSVGVISAGEPGAVNRFKAEYEGADHLILNYGRRPFVSFDRALMERALS